jgi:hypothetical protein
MDTYNGESPYVRRNIWDLEAETPWDPITLAFANAIKVLQTRPLTDPTSWEYLSAIHGRSGPALSGTTWNQCQHGNWYFLPWHRMYLYYFERIVRAEVVNQAGPDDWALPFWDYSNPTHAALPPAFRQTTMPDGSDNPLFVPDRVPAANAGGRLPASITSADHALGFTGFIPPPPPGFGGGITAPSHFFTAHGQLEFTPHNDVHSVINGWMGDPDMAALDPIFWLHHCNIDRLWAVWLDKGGGRVNPSETLWLEQTFAFHDENGTQERRPVSDFRDTAQLGYTYEGIPAPTAADEVRASQGSAADPATPDPEMVGASEQPVTLTGNPASVDVSIDARAVEARAGDRAAAGPEHVYLNLEDIEAQRAPAVAYEVYISGDPTSAEAPRYIGNVSFFGIEHYSRTDLDDDGPHGFRRTFDITSRVAEMRAQNAWNEERVVVSFRPVGMLPPPDSAAEDTTESLAVRARPVRIGRVSIFHG